MSDPAAKVRRQTPNRQGDMKTVKISLIVIALFTLFGGSAIGRNGSAIIQSKNVDFERDIEPIFKTSCVGCHGPRRQMAGLRMDDRASVVGKIALPGKSAESPLYRRIAGAGDDARMPLGMDALPAEKIELIKRWIDEGAQWPEKSAGAEKVERHWAFVAPVRPAIPHVSNSAWVKNPIDSFILAKLDKKGLAPSTEAEKRVLLRRLSLDLTGLPPSPQEVDAFLSDKDPRAYEKAVERLLASPHYGERWGRHWLDAARYADSDGYEKDKLRRVWFYRDWVINSLNRDKPYDQFIIEQVAGDLLPNATQDQKVATGFLRNSMINEEGGIDPEQFRMEAMFDRMDAIGKSVLGITIQCAQCHNHKFDPLKQEEYYRLFAFLNNSHESNIAVYTSEEQMKRANVFSSIREIEAMMRERMPDWQSRMNAWEDNVKNDQPEWIIARATVNDISTGGQRYLPFDDGSFLAQGYAPTKHTVRLEWETDIRNITGFRLELLNDQNLPLGGPGRSIKGTGALTEFNVEVAPKSDPKKIEKIKFRRATADYNQPVRDLEPIFDDKSKRKRITGPIDFAIDGVDETAWGIDAGPGLRNVPRKAVFTAEQPVSHEGGSVIHFLIKQNHGGWNSDDNQNNNLGRIRVSVTTAPDPSADPLPAAVREIFGIPREKRSEAQVRTIFNYWRTTIPVWKAENERIAELWNQHPEGSSQLVLDERAKLRETHLLKRGDFLKPDRVVEPGVPAFLHPLPAGATPDRLTFARWLVDRKSPTAARSIVNRIWQGYFGTGIVATSEDFGRQSEAPSHPELLDWLAVELMDNGWSLKHIHRLIATSATYRQSSRVTPELLAKDPYNRLLARGARFRVEAEVVRDIALAAGGLLNPKVGGPSVFPPSPDFLYQPPASYGPKVWDEEKGENRYRRAIYTFRYRSVPYPMLQTFDAPTGDIACVRRARSNTPLQALMTLNETLFVEAARALALKTLSEAGPGDQSRLGYAFRRVLSRLPSQSEQTELLGLLDRQRSRFVNGELNPWNLATSDPDKPFPLPKGTRMEDLAAWTVVSRVLLNLDETITRE